MISLHYTTKDHFSRYGINHFIERFGILVEINKPSSSEIVIVYGEKANGAFIIAIEENEIKNTICGRICTQFAKIPICEIPLDIGLGEEVIAYFENGTTKFPCVTRTKQGITIGIDIFKETGYLLSGHLDVIRPSLNGSTQKEMASIPIVDFLENLLFNAIVSGCHKRHLPLVQKSFWPEGKKFAVCLTHDVDEIKKTYQWISRPLRFLTKRDFSGFKDQVYSFIQRIKGSEPYYTYDEIIRIEHDLGVKSTYFILKESGNANLFSKKTWYLYGRNRTLKSHEMRALIQRLTANGDEVAIHGSYFSYKDPMLLHEETRELEQIINEKVIGTRQHNLNLEVPTTWNLQHSAGLKYDTTLGFKDTIGFRWGTSFPFFPNVGEGPPSLLEIPLIIMDICLESKTDKIVDCLRIADEVGRYQGVLTLLWHPPIFNPLEYPDARDIYIKINQYCLDNGAWTVRARDIYEWLSLRNRQTFSIFYHGSQCSIIPSKSVPEQYFTLTIPQGAECTIRSGNADIIKKDRDCVYIKTLNLQKDNEIIIGIS
jgi:peptidoglycan/xylan/chitin deacetylase (PgdA/CDA1 family)